MEFLFSGEAEALKAGVVQIDMIKIYDD